MLKVYRFASNFLARKPFVYYYTVNGLCDTSKEWFNFSRKASFAHFRKYYDINKNICSCQNINFVNSKGSLPENATKLISYVSNRGNGYSNNFNSISSMYLLFAMPLGISLFNNKDVVEDEDDVTKMIKLAVLAIQKEELQKAEKLLHVALKSAQELNNVNAVTYIFDLMANLAMHRNDFKKAEKLFKDVLQRFLNRGIPIDDNAVVEVSLKLAGVYANLGQYEMANEGFCFCIENQDRKLRNAGEGNVDEATLVLWAMCQDWYARFLLSMGKYDRAKNHFLQAYEVCNKVMGPEDSQTAILLNDLGSVSSLQKNYDEAIEYLLKAIEIGKKVESEDLCSFYINLGTVYMQKGLSKEAELFCKTGLKIAEEQKNTEAINEGTSCLDILKSLQTA